MQVLGRRFDGKNFAIATLFSMLIVSLAYPSQFQANLNDRGQGGPDTVTFTLFKYHQLLPDPHLLANGAWKVIAWDENGITYQTATHNGMTNCYANYLQYQLFPGASSVKNSTATGYISLSTNSSTPVTADQKTNCWLQGEITANGLARHVGAITYNSSALSNLVVTFKVTYTFTATGTQANIYTAGLAYQGTAACSATYSTNKCYIAISALPNAPINMGSADTLQVSWSNVWTGS